MIRKINHILTTHTTNYKLSTLLTDLKLNIVIFQNLDLTITLAAGCNATIIDDLATDKIQCLNLTIIIFSESSLNLLGYLTTQAVSIEKKITVQLAGSHANANVFYQGIVHTTQTIKINTKQNHARADTTSKLTVKTALKNKAKLICNALIYIAPEAEQVQALQVNKNLLLSHQTVATSSPQLEVLSHQVKCSHGSAMSYLDEEKVFFLQSRGFSKTKAKNLLIVSFLQE